jgi:hypothetical protein
LQQLIESLFCGTWRSYKAFSRSGEVENHSTGKYLEFDFGEGKQLTISAYVNGDGKKLEETRDWTVLFQNKRHYICINGKSPKYEVITINHVAFVLMDTKTNKKFFCARPLTWATFIKSPSL